MQEQLNAPATLPRDNLVRAVYPAGVELRETPADGGMPTMVGHFATFNEWTRIDSVFEGQFMERIATGAFTKTFTENRANMRVTFNHGHDPQLGDKVLGPIAELREDDVGAYYEVPLFDTHYNRELLPGLQAGQYGASFRFNVIREDVDKAPERSEFNPEGIPERTIREARVAEWGPVTFPAYSGATAGVRSMTDEFIFDNFTHDPKRLVELIDTTRALKSAEAPSEPAPSHDTPESECRDAEPKPAPAPREEQVPDTELRSKGEMVSRISELKSTLTQMAEEYPGVLPAEPQTRWDEAEAELTRVEADLSAKLEREAKILRFKDDPRNTEPERVTDPFQVRPTPPSDPYDRASVYRDAKSPDDAAHRFKDNAMRVAETATFPHERANREEVQGHIEKLLREDSRDAETARRILLTGSPAYRRAFPKALAAGSLDMLTPEERTAMAEGAGATGGFAITFDLDPTIVPTSNGAVNPYRRVCRVVKISGTNEWRGVSSGAVVATYEAEATEAVDRSPTLAQPAFVTKRAQTFIPFSIELGQDWGALQSELAGLIQDAKDTLEAVQFSTGVGTTVFPQGLVVGATNTATTGTTTVLAVNDIYKTEEALPPRFRPRAQWFANRFIYNKIRQLDTAGGANLWVENLRQGLPANETGNTGYNLIGYPANEASGMAASLATTTKIAVLGDPNYYVIVERVGLDIELIPHLFGPTAHYPTGQRGIYAMWRNTGRVFDAAGFITLVGA